MERKIGEIFEHNGEWYQCIESPFCGECSLFTTECGSGTKSNLADKVFGRCSKVRRFDKKQAIFKKLEKVGEPFSEYNPSSNRVILFQRYKCYQKPVFNDNITGTWRYWFESNTIEIEIKQNKEDMEEKNKEIEQIKIENVIRKYMDDKISFDDFAKELEAILFSDKEESKPNLKEFDLEAAKVGKPVCTRDGRKARIICFDTEGNKPLIVLSRINGQEVILRYTEKGQSDNFHSPTPREDDLMMLPEKKEGWVNVYKDGLLDTKSYPTKKEAFDKASPKDYVDTIKINWEE